MASAHKMSVYGHSDSHAPVYRARKVLHLNEIQERLFSVEFSGEVVYRSRIPVFLFVSNANDHKYDLSNSMRCLTTDYRIRFPRVRPAQRQTRSRRVSEHLPGRACGDRRGPRSTGLDLTQGLFQFRDAHRIQSRRHCLETESSYTARPFTDLFDPVAGADDHRSDPWNDHRSLGCDRCGRHRDDYQYGDRGEHGRYDG